MYGLRNKLIVEMRKGLTDITDLFQNCLRAELSGVSASKNLGGLQKSMKSK